MPLRYDWRLKELTTLYEEPLLQLVSKAHTLHKEHAPANEVQMCHLISIKTGGCPEDCKYCSQSSRYQTATKATPMMKCEEVVRQAKEAKELGATRVCLGAAWKGTRDGKQFDEVLQMIKEITSLGLEVCVTLGTLTEEHAQRLKEAGLFAYNHNLDSSKEFYKTIITTRTYEERLATLDLVEKANISVCCGGIIGMGESVEDRLKLLHTLCTRNPHPDSVPINRLSRIPGTPLADQPEVPFWEMLRMVAIARIVMPKAMVRLSAGRIDMSYEQQALCFMAGANSLFAGEKLLTVANKPQSKDEEMFTLLGLQKRPAFAH